MDWNLQIEEYESELRKAERDIEAALQAICSLDGEEIGQTRYNLQCKALEEVQNALRGAYRLYR